ncbi:MAG: alpha/beta hydrolase [Chloroflexi bacterium]|nr:alpha/beta hydrolase [Chloroflexota bacterium]
MNTKRSTLLFLHGSGCNGAVWAHQSRFFSSRYRVVAPDLPGHGRHKGELKKDIADYAWWVFSEIKRQGLEKPVVIGHSLGGAIALQLAIQMPDVPGALVLVGTGARLRVHPKLLETIRNNYEEALSMVSDYAFSPATAPNLIGSTRRQMRKSPAEVLLEDFQACDHFDVMQDVAGIALPTLVVVGQDDRLTPIRYSEYLHKNILGSRLEIVANAGHMVMLEQPEVFNNILLDFLEAMHE